MINSDEARNTLENESFYLIKPDNSFFKSNIDEGAFNPVPNDFNYDSKTNDQWVTQQQIETLLSSFPEEI